MPILQTYLVDPRHNHCGTHAKIANTHY